MGSKADQRRLEECFLLRSRTHRLGREHIKDQNLMPPHTMKPEAEVGEVRAVFAIGAPRGAGDNGPTAAVQHTEA